MAQKTTKKTWGGPWTEDKLEAFESYVKAYLTIMNPRRDKNKWTLIYFDGFAGNGTRTEEEKTEEVSFTGDLFSEEITQEELYVYKGAAERVVRLEENGIRGFDKYYFIDNNKENCDALESRLNKYSFQGKAFHRPMDANKAIKELARIMKMHKGCKTLALLDPFGMQIKWESLQALAGLDVDLWILIPTGVIVNRLLRRNNVVDKGFLHPEKLKSFFGLSEDEIKRFFYMDIKEESLFGEEGAKIIKRPEPIQRIAELYVQQLRNVFTHVTPKPLVLESLQGRPLFHFVFASNNATGLKIAQYIINKKKA